MRQVVFGLFGPISNRISEAIQHAEVLHEPLRASHADLSQYFGLLVPNRRLVECCEPNIFVTFHRPQV